MKYFDLGEGVLRIAKNGNVTIKSKNPRKGSIRLNVKYGFNGMYKSEFTVLTDKMILKVID